MIKASASPCTLDQWSVTQVRILCFFYRIVISIDNFIQVSSYTFRYVVELDDQTYRSPQT
jgi:hypothetical protein